MRLPIRQARKLLERSGYTYYDDHEDFLEDEESLVLNMNDTFAWATAWSVEIPDNKLIEVADLFQRYGYAGLVYWVSETNNQMKSAFYDINRYIEFVRREEKVIKEMPESNQRAYTRVTYTIGE